MTMRTLLESIERLSEHLDISLKIQLTSHDIIIFLLKGHQFSKTTYIWLKKLIFNNLQYYPT